MFEDVVEPAPAVEREFDFLDEPDTGDEVLGAKELQRRLGGVARQAALDPDDGVEL